MNDRSYLNLAHLSGEVWGTQSRATSAAGVDPTTGARLILGYDVFFEIFDRLKEDFKKEVDVETEIEHGEDD